MSHEGGGGDRVRVRDRGVRAHLINELLAPQRHQLHVRGRLVGQREQIALKRQKQINEEK